MSNSENKGIPRRVRLDLSTPAELAIRNAVCEVEKMPADVRLTKAVNLLDEARELVADFIDGVQKSEEQPAPQDFRKEKEKYLDEMEVKVREAFFERFAVHFEDSQESYSFYLQGWFDGKLTSDPPDGYVLLPGHVHEKLKKDVEHYSGMADGLLKCIELLLLTKQPTPSKTADEEREEMLFYIRCYISECNAHGPTIGAEKIYTQFIEPRDRELLEAKYIIEGLLLDNPDYSYLEEAAKEWLADQNKKPTQ